MIQCKLSHPSLRHAATPSVSRISVTICSAMAFTLPVAGTCCNDEIIGHRDNAGQIEHVNILGFFLFPAHWQAAFMAASTDTLRSGGIQFFCAVFFAAARTAATFVVAGTPF